MATTLPTGVPKNRHGGPAGGTTNFTIVQGPSNSTLFLHRIFGRSFWLGFRWITTVLSTKPNDVLVILVKITW